MALQRPNWDRNYLKSIPSAQLRVKCSRLVGRQTSIQLITDACSVPALGHDDQPDARVVQETSIGRKRCQWEELQEATAWCCEGHFSELKR
jgi:hypothetical protein